MATQPDPLVHRQIHDWRPEHAASVMPKRTTRELREALAEGPVVAAGCFDPLSARLAEYVGFAALHVTGSGVEATQLGAPDLGLLTLSELASHTARIAAAVDIPMICDIDTGFGGIDNVIRTIRELERAGVAGVHIEDQQFPKRSPLLGGRSILSRAEAVGRVEAALAARADADFVVVARSDADAISFDEVVTRCNLYLEAGADVAFPMLMSYDDTPLTQLSRDQRNKIQRKLVEEINGPVMAMAHPFGPNDPSVSETTDTGAAIVITATVSLHAATNAMLAVLREMKEHGEAVRHFDRNPELISQYEVYRMLGMDNYLENHRRFIPAPATDPSPTP